MRNAERALIAIALVASASAAQAETRRPVDLPAGSLGSAVVALGRQAGISIGVSDPRLAALPVRRVRGQFTVRQALQKLLDGTDAGFVNIGADSWRIVRRMVPTPQRVVQRAVIRPAVMTVEEPPPDDIIVTGNKRATPLSDYPGSVSVLRMDDLPVGAEGRGTDAIAQRLPGVGSTHFGPGRNKLFIRGIADSSFNGPTQATVGQYLGETRLNYNAPDPDLRLYDIATIEVLQGPQGTLHGAGSLGGVMRILPVAPRLGETQASAALSAAATAHGAPSYDANFMVNLPIAGDAVAVRAVGYAVRDGGYIDDTLRDLKDVNRTDTYGGRISLRAEPAPGWTVDIGGTYQSIRGRDSQYANRDLVADLVKESPIAQAFGNDYALGQFVVRKQWDSGLSFVSATGIVRQDIDETYDATQPDGPPTLFRQLSRITLLSSENRLAYDMDGGLSWVVGSSLVRNHYRLARSTGAEMINNVTGVSNRVDEATLFGEMTLAITPSLSVTGGGRLTHARLSGDALDAPLLEEADVKSQARRSETTFLPSLAFNYSPGSNFTLFARYQEGFRPGGIAVRNNFVQRYQNDDVASTEVGLRYGGTGTGDLNIALSVAHTRWNDIQADLIDDTGLPATNNIGDGRIWSVDATIGWRPLPGLLLEASGVYADSKLTDPFAPAVVLRSSLVAYDGGTGVSNGGLGSVFPLPATAVIAESDDLPNVARFNARIGADYSTVLRGGFDLRVSGWARYVGRSRLGVGPVLGVSQGNYLDTALSARIGRGGYGLFLSATNLFDTIGNRFALGSPFTLPHERQITPLRPRTLRIGMDIRF